MADTRTMSELLQAPTEGYRDAIVHLPILAENVELKVGLIQFVTSCQFHGFERDEPHAYIRWFNKIISTIKYQNVSNEAIKLMLFLFSLDRASRIWLEKEPPRSILTWEDLAWDRFKDLLRKCPHHDFSELHQIDTFYNALTQSDQDSLNAPAGGNLLNRTPRDALTIIENKSKIIKELVLMNKATQQATVKAIEETCVTCGEPHPYYEYLATGGNTFDACAAVGTYNQGVQIPILELKVVSKRNPKPTILYPLRLNNQKLHKRMNNQMLKFLQIFERLHFDPSFADALLLIPKFSSTFKSLLSYKEIFFELASTPLNENCSVVLLKKLSKKLRKPDKFLISCDFPKLEEYLALADLGASINLMTLFVWKMISLPELTATRMTLQLANRSVTYSVGVAEDFFAKVGKFHFPSNFVVVDYDVDPRVSLMLGRPFLRTE
nr:reverse transcriptase domain-containing protein [Tanacetum cinerariifolium]